MFKTCHQCIYDLLVLMCIIVCDFPQLIMTILIHQASILYQTKQGVMNDYIPKGGQRIKANGDKYSKGAQDGARGKDGNS